MYRKTGKFPDGATLVKELRATKAGAYTTDAKTVNVTKGYKKDCLGCYIPAKGKDWIYTEAYPTLLP